MEQNRESKKDLDTYAHLLMAKVAHSGDKNLLRKRF